MKFFYRWLGRKINNANEGCYINESKQKRLIKGRGFNDSDELTDNPVNFKMHKANGGWVIEFKKYDQTTDMVDSTLYIVNKNEDIGKSLSHIITMEALKH